MKSIYNFGIYCYKQLVALAGIRNVKARKLTQGQKGIFDYLSRHADPQGGYLWIHASSLGEFEQGRPLIEAIKKAQPDTKILLTFFSPSGYEVRKDYSGADLICYLPFDLPGNVRRFLDLTKPTKPYLLNMNFGRTTSTNLNAGIYPRILSRLSSAPNKYSSVLMEDIFVAF